MTEIIKIRKASRKKAKLRLGISAPSGAGKTLGALLLAYGIVRATYPNLPDEAIWGKIGMTDTEEGSGELYVGVEKYNIKIGEYEYIRLSKDFSPVRYLNAIHAFEEAGVEVIIVDSLTHAWAGTEGLLEKQARVVDADPKKNSYTAWRSVTPQHNALVNAMLQSSCHIIGTMRSKVEYAMETGINGKQQVRKLGMAPIQREGMEYEFTVFFDINSDSIATATKDRTDLFSTVDAVGKLEKRSFLITPTIGGELSKWLETGVEPIELVADRMAADINASIDLEATYAAQAEAMKRLELERPEWVEPMLVLFNARDEELKKGQNTA